MDVELFDYYLPSQLIAQFPAERRDHSRLMVLDLKRNKLEHRFFYQLPHLLLPGDLLVLNDTKVIKVRLYGQRENSGGTVEIFLTEKLSNRYFKAMAKPFRRAKIGERIIFKDGQSYGIVVEKGKGELIIELVYSGRFDSFLNRCGTVPLPPYIKRKRGIEIPLDEKRYQTIYAKNKGALAAPTAGLHFTRKIIKELSLKGVEIVYLTLHTGAGTFRPVRTKRVEDHRMEKEYFCISEESAKAINQARIEGRRVIAVGTTVTRALESAILNGMVYPAEGETELFIYPGYEFKTIDGIITNFHLPKSTLLMMISAFAGRERLLNAYKIAIEKGYRFYSYGDAMLILKK